MKYDIIIIGGGIVGLATAYQTLLKKPKLKLLLLEKESALAKHQTGNNSGVIHSGLYYKPGSLKATNCITGYQMLLDFCDQEGLTYDLCGKVVVATENFQKPLLENLYQRGLENGLDKISRISVEELK
ncbi:MAG: L-2-hydroxyglutarate oxidase, partial [Roseivirga sp.]